MIPDDPIVRASWAGTAVFAAAEAAGVASDAARPFTLGVNTLLFLAGVVIFFWAYAVADGRSRTDNIGIGGLFFLAGDTAPKPVRRTLLASLVLELVVAFGAAALRPFTSLAFGVLSPLYALALTGLWGARNGTFGPRPDRLSR
jgi:hypothetical protein